MLPRAKGILAVEVGAKRGAFHLAQLLHDTLRAPAGRMTELFDLRCECARPAASQVRINPAADPAGARLGETLPLDGWIVLGVARLKQILVFDEQKCPDHKRRDRIEVFVGSLGIARGVDWRAL